MITTKVANFFSTLREGLVPYVKLSAYLKPYRLIFVCGTVCGIGFGAISGAIPLVIAFVGKAVFSSGPEVNLLNDIDKLGVMAKPVQFLAVNILHLDSISKSFLVLVACLLIPAVMMTRSVLDFLNSYCSEWTSQKVLLDIRSDLMASVTAQSLDYFNSEKAGNLFQRIINETREMRTTLTIMNTQLISQPVTIVSGLLVLFKLDWRFTVGALVLMPLCIGPMLILGKKIRQTGRAEAGEGRDMMVILHEMIAGIKVIKSFSRTKHELARFDASSRQQFKISIRARRLMEATSPVVESLAAIGIAIGLYYVYSVGMSGTTFLALCVGIFLIYHPLKTLSRTHIVLLRSGIVMEGVFKLMGTKPSVVDAPDAVTLSSCRGEISFQDVNFSYRADIPALADFDFKFEQGKYYALVGESGAGKSTLLSLIMRFYDPNSGRVLIDGRDIKSVTQDSLREQIGIVTQETFLFHETIYKNIAYGRLDATKEEVIEAAKLAHAHQFIIDQQNGYETIIGDKGCMLSGGQQQRIAIARAILKNAPILLLDEATSALDSASEKHIQAALDVLASGRTVIAIAHRLSTILKADQILVLDQGKVKAIGTHEELVREPGIYRKLYNLQFNVQPTEKQLQPDKA